METLISLTPEVDSSNPLPIGTRLQEFVIEQVIGIGGFGIVYQANDTLLRRKVAIKEFMPTSMALRSEGNTVCLRSAAHLKDFETGKETFMDEARMLAQFKHPALIEVLRFWEQNRTAYMVTPFYKGRTLHDYLRALPSVIAEADLRRILLPVLDALAHMHAGQVYHRDISPDNIMVLDDGSPILLDLGAARRLEALNPRAFTVLVKPGYAPIEQYAGEVAGLQGPWTDLYGWAASAYFALTGKPPPPSASRVMADTISKLVEIKPAGYTQNFLAAIDAALAVRPDDRPQSVEALRETLAIESEAQIAMPVPSVNNVPNQRGKPVASLVLAGLCFIALLAGGWWMTKPSVPATAAIAGKPINAQPSIAVPVVVPAPVVASTPVPVSVPVSVPSSPPSAQLAEPMLVETALVETVLVDKPAIARLAIKPWGEVFVNGVQKGVSPPLKTLSLEPGEYKIELRNGDYPARQFKLDLKAGQIVSLKHTFTDDAPNKAKP